MHRSVLAILALFLCALLATFAADPGATKEYIPSIRPASDEAVRAMTRIRVPAGMKIDLWAAEPMLANPVIFCIDAKNRIFVAETFRLHAGVPDIRGIMPWLDDDLACRTVADRVAMMKRRLGKKVADSTVHHDRIRLLEDVAGSGKADRSTVFADGFNSIETGLGAGLLARVRMSITPASPTCGGCATARARARPTSARSSAPATAFTSATSATICTA